MSRRFLWLSVFVLAAAGGFLALRSFPSLREDPVEIRVTDTIPVRRGELANAVRFAVASVTATGDGGVAFDSLARHLEGVLGRPVRIVERKRTEEVSDLLRSKAVQLAWLPAGAFFAARRQGLDLEILAVPYYAAGPTSRSITVVRADSDVGAFADLKGRSFAFTDPTSLTGHAHPVEWVLEGGYDPQTFFPEATFTYSNEESIEAVLNAVVDGAAVDSLALDAETRRRPALATRLRIVHTSPPLGVGPLVVPASLAAEEKAALRAALEQAATSATGEGPLGRLGITRFGQPPKGLYDADEDRFRTLMDRLESPR